MGYYPLSSALIFSLDHHLFLLTTKMSAGSLVCTWLGHAAFKLQCGDFVLLIDPWMENPKAPAGFQVLMGLKTNNNNKNKGKKYWKRRQG